MGKYNVTIGLEMHCEISETNTKVFSGAKNEYSEYENTNISAVDMGFPGVLPVVNKKCIEFSLMMSMVLNCNQPEYMYFLRKNYYYPDLPKGYQITQNPPHECVGMNGFALITRDDNTKFRVDIDNLHLEEDAAAMEHGYGKSLINYNRSGVPLLELVTKPCIHSADDAVYFLEYMRSAYQYCGVSEADSKKGQIKCDVNVSISDSDKLGTKVEIKNVNSFGGVRDAINYEIERQSNLKDEGRYDEVVQETRRWDDTTGTTIRMREKVDAVDYKYFVDPNIPKYKISEEWKAEIRKRIPKLRDERRQIYIDEYSLSDYDATVLVKDKEISDYFEDIVKEGIDAKVVCNWVTTIIVGSMNKLGKNLSDLGITSKMLSNVLKLVVADKLSRPNAKKALYKAMDELRDPMEIIDEDKLAVTLDDNLLIKYINESFDENPHVVEEFKSGKDYVANFFVGQVMKKTKGQANPTLIKELIKQEIVKR